MKISYQEYFKTTVFYGRYMNNYNGTIYMTDDIERYKKNNLFKNFTSVINDIVIPGGYNFLMIRFVKKEDRHVIVSMLLVSCLHQEVTYGSYSIVEGKGYNKELRTALMNQLTLLAITEGPITLWTYSVNPVSDCILRKLDVPRTEEFEQALVKCNQKYDEAVRLVKRTHQKVITLYD